MELWTNLHAATMCGNAPYGAIENAAVAVEDGRIAWVGPAAEAPPCPTVHDAGGAWATPGLIDCHTHLVHGSSRAREFEQRLAGASYEELARAGGGILGTVAATRALDEAALVAAALPRLDALLAEGVTTVEVKSGYGLETETECRMLRAARALSAAEWGRLVLNASPHAGPRPLVQVWHGDADGTVSAENGRELAQQWAAALGLPEKPSRTEHVDGARHESWLDGSGQARLEYWTVPGLGHGTPITPNGADLDSSVGIPGPHMLASSVSSTWHLARRWGLLTQAAAPRPHARPAEPSPARPSPSRSGFSAVGVVERALRTAGLMR